MWCRNSTPSNLINRDRDALPEFLYLSMFGKEGTVIVNSLSAESESGQDHEAMRGQRIPRGLRSPRMDVQVGGLTEKGSNRTSNPISSSVSSKSFDNFSNCILVLVVCP